MSNSSYNFSLVVSYQDNEYTELKQGDSIVLMPDLNNPADKKAIAAFLGDIQVGYIANSKETVLKGTMSATQLYSLIVSAKVEKTTALIKEYRPFTNKAGNSQDRFLCEAFFVPKREKKEEIKVNYEYEVGGLSSKNCKKSVIMGKLVKDADDGKESAIPLEIRSIQTPAEEMYLVFEPGNIEGIGDSCGEVKDVDDELRDMFADKDIVPCMATKIKNKKGYVIEVAPSAHSSLDRFYPAIDAAVGRGVGQSPSLEEKVSFMTSSRFPDDAIEAVLAQMPALTQNVHRPRQFYRQKNGTNLADVVSYMLFGKMIRLVGEKGSGKNTLVETAAWLLNRPLCRVQGSSELDKLDILGSKTLTDGNTGFELSEMLETLRDDGIVVVDEANTIRPDVLTLLHSLTDGARSIDVPGYGTVHMGDHACILYTMNEDYVGTGEMNAATIDRGPSLIIKQESNLAGLLKNAVPDADPANVELCVKVSIEIQKAVKESGTLGNDAVTVRGYIDALEASKYIPIKRALIQNVANKAQSESERTAIEVIIAAFCG